MRVSKLVAGLPILLFACAADDVHAPAAPMDLTSWPNARSCCNSDSWLAEHHAEITRLEPRVLVLLFDNDTTPTDARALVDRLIAALAESSRDHGYDDPDAPVQLQYHVSRLVDLRDPVPAPGFEHRNSSRFPLTDHGAYGTTFDYGALHRSPLVELYDVHDEAGQRLDLCGMLDHGMIHEVWLVLHADDLEPRQSALEVVEAKQRWDEDFHKIEGNYTACAGNGCDELSRFCGRSLRVLTINAHRGPGCAMESLAHGVEWTAQWTGRDGRDAIPWFTTYFREFAGFDLHAKYDLPDFSLYGCKDVAYPDPETMDWTCNDGTGRAQSGRAEHYVPVCGNVHWAPNGRNDYDLDSPYEVDSTCEGWRQGGGPDGADVVKRFTTARIDPNRQLADDCMGPFLVYWRQNWPGHGSKAKDGAGAPMRSFWPFLFY